jgi:hypothetical protein
LVQTRWGTWIAIREDLIQLRGWMSTVVYWVTGLDATTITAPVARCAIALGRPFPTVDREHLKASEVIAKERQGSILREFPGQWLDRTLKEIGEAARQGDRSARKALKLLNIGRFKK